MIDLHCHTRISDSSCTIEEVIALAKQNGVSHLAITDHDTTMGLERALQIGRMKGVEIIPGIEISAFDHKRNRRAHILGLFVEPGHEAIEQLCRPLREERHAASYMMVQKIIEAGYQITWEDAERFAEGGTGVFKQHIMHALIEKQYTRKIYGELYRTLFSRGSETEPPGLAYVPLHYVDAEEAIRTIRAAGGVPVLAHPGQFNNFPAIEGWAAAGLEGLEVSHPLHDKSDEIKAKAIAERCRLVQTGGSDYHGFYGDTGAVIGSKSTEPESFEKLLERREKVGR